MTNTESELMEKIVSLCKRRGFIFQGSEIYGGLANTWDYGPYGVELKNNLKREWWRTFVQKREDIVGLDSAILMNPSVWEASGHVDSFTDPLIDCKNCQERIRGDKLVEEKYDKEFFSYLDSLIADIKVRKEKHDLVKALMDGESNNDSDWAVKEILKDIDQRKGDLMKLVSYIVNLDPNLKCPKCGSRDFTEARSFNLMFKTFQGVIEDTASLVYLRPETAQGIFINFKNIEQVSRKKLPFGIAQIGKAFRNEITPGNFIYRTREFEMMEIEYFVKAPKSNDDQKNIEKMFEDWKDSCLNWYKDLGINSEKLRFRYHDEDELSHYSTMTCDIEYKFPFGWGELEGIAYRTDFDLKQHIEHSKVDLSYFDQERNEKYIPHVIEPSFGSDRSLLTFLIDAYDEDEIGGEKRKVMRFHPKLAPVKVAVLPLVKKEKLTKKAREIYQNLTSKLNCEYDESGSIGKRYRRHDEIGTPYCITVDFDSLEDDSVTVRDRDTTEQKRIKIVELKKYFSDKF